MSSSLFHMTNGEDNSSTCQYIDLSYDPANSDSSAKAIICALRPEWKTSDGDVEFVRFKEGITNSLFKATKSHPSSTPHTLDSEAIMLRAYGSGTDLIIDREREATSHLLLSRHNLAPPLYARFNNGLLYKYISGRACCAEDLRHPPITCAIARLLGIWHATLPIAEAAGTPLQFEHIALYLRGPGKPQTNLWTVMQKWIGALPSRTTSEQERNARLAGEVEFATQLLGNTPGLNADGEYILGHCDLLSGNVIILPDNDSKTTSVSFIDYEYATPVPAAFDLANHFAEWGGFECDYTVLPTRSQRRAFIREYVRSFRSHSPPQSHAHKTQSNSCNTDEEADIARLMAEVDAFRGIPGLYWGIWALIQAQISEIEFDYSAYAEVRLGEYWDWKGCVKGGRDGEGKEGREMGTGTGTSVREKRLALEE